MLGIHRIRMDSDNRLLWDLFWFAAFGLLFVAAGWWLTRRSGSGSGDRRGRRGRRAAPVALALVMAAGPVAALPPRDMSTVMVLLPPGTGINDVVAAAAAADASLVWSDASGSLWALALGDAGDPLQLCRHGALLVSNSILPTGCLDWIRA